MKLPAALVVCDECGDGHDLAATSVRVEDGARILPCGHERGYAFHDVRVVALHPASVDAIAEAVAAKLKGRR